MRIRWRKTATQPKTPGGKDARIKKHPANKYQVLGHNSAEVIASGDGKIAFDQVYLGIFNPHYKILGVAVGRRWVERTRENTDLTMVASTATYNWPTNPIIKEPFYVEGLDVNASNDPYAITPAPTMEAWSMLDDSNDAQPIYYKLRDVAGVLKVELRPNPDQADPIRITSLAGVRKFPTTAKSTVDSDSAGAQTVLSVAATTPFAAEDHVVIGEGTAREERGVIASLSAGVSVTMAANLTFAHTAVQADTVEMTTPFVDFDTDQAVVLFTAALLISQRGDTARALELIEQGRGMLPLYDRTPKFTSGGFIHSWAV